MTLISFDPKYQPESLVMLGGNRVISKDIGRTQRQQAYDDILELQKEFAAMLYYQRDQERNVR